MAQVIWGTAKGASSYSVQAVTDQGSSVTCNTTTTSCVLNGLQCSNLYNITVMAQNLACNNTVASQPILFMTGVLAHWYYMCVIVDHIDVRLCVFTSY